MDGKHMEVRERGGGAEGKERERKGQRRSAGRMTSPIVSGRTIWLRFVVLRRGARTFW